MALLDRYTIDTLGLDGKLLMSSAARETLRVIREKYPAARHPVIFAGTGNNGGDGVALAYYALQSGLLPLLVLCHPEISDPPRLSEDSTYFFNIAQRAYVPINYLANPAVLAEVISGASADLVVDALFGTGLDRPLSDYWLALIERLNQVSCPVVSIDAPSGLNCETGEVMDGVICADTTVTMGFAKRGFYHPGAASCLGELHIAKLGFGPLSDAGIVPESNAWPDALWHPLTVPRKAATHKGNYGRVLIVAGHASYPGAPRLAARAALRCGAGLVRLVVPEPIFSACCEDPSVMVEAHSTDGSGGFAATPDENLLSHLDWADALVLGPGLSDAGPGLELVRALLNHRDLPTVLDADGLRAFPAACDHSQWPLVLTPHVGELARLTGVIPDEAWEHWFRLAVDYAVKHGVFLLAKSNQCMLATPEGAMIFPHAGIPALASGGTGDVLSGIIGALLARCHAMERDPATKLSHLSGGLRLEIAEIIASAVNIHSAAARAGIQYTGEESFTATDLVEMIPDALRLLKTGE